MARWKDHHILSKTARRLIFGTENPTPASVAIYTLTQYDRPIIKPVKEESPQTESEGHPPPLPSPGRPGR